MASANAGETQNPRIATVVQQMQCLSFEKKCRNAVGASIWLDLCFVRYENYSFIGHLSTSRINISGLQNQQNASFSKPFNKALSSLFDNLTDEAANGSASWNRYASGITTDTFFRNISGLVQCWRDISKDDCTTCLSNTIKSIFADYPGRQGAQGLTRSCIVRYEVYPFFNSTAPPPPSTEAPANDPAKQINKSLNKTPIILGVVGGFLLALLVCLFATGRRLKAAIKRRGYEGIFI